jgi:hypothetical protein
VSLIAREVLLDRDEQVEELLKRRAERRKVLRSLVLELEVLLSASTVTELVGDVEELVDLVEQHPDLGTASEDFWRLWKELRRHWDCTRMKRALERGPIRDHQLRWQRELGYHLGRMYMYTVEMRRLK